MSDGKCIIFLGPSLHRSEAERILKADYRPPAAQGDIFRACADKPAAVGLIDGVFKDTPTVRHREILWAMSQGIPVFGAASMGALRAAELSADGMIAIGVIARWYRRFEMLPDDAVAVTYGPAELGSLPLSDALVDIRQRMKAATRQGLLSREAAANQIARITALPFGERSFPKEIKDAGVSQKAKDARRLLCHLATLQAEGDWPKMRHRETPIVHAWLDDLHDSGLELARVVTAN